MRYLLFILSIFAIPIAGYSQIGSVVKTINLSYNESDFSFVEDEGLLRIYSDSLMSTFDNDTLAPSMPYIPVNVLIRPNDTYVSFSTRSTETELMDNVLMYPNELAIPTDMPAPPRKARPVSYAPAIYPIVQDSFEGHSKADGYNYLTFLVCPFRYDSSARKLYLRNEIELNIRLIQTPQPLTANANFASSKESLKRIIINNNEFEDGYIDNSGIINMDSLGHSGEWGGGTVTNDSIDLETMDYRYLIVTNELLRPSFQRLADWKTMKGVRAKVITVEEVDSMDNSNDTLQLKIKKAVKNYYNGECKGLQYLLLGGDDNIVPALHCVLKYNGRQSMPPVDMYYACMDNSLNWDANGNGIYGELNDNVDAKPEFAVTRISVKNTNDAENIIDRIINYESLPGTWSPKILMAGDYRVFEYPPSVPVKIAYNTGMAECSANELYNNYIQNYWDGHRDQFFETFTDIDGDSLSFDYLNFNQLMGKGYPFVNVDVHGTSISKLLVFNEHVYPKSIIDTLVNNGNTVFLTSACHTNDFTVEEWRECQSEYLLRSPNSGILAYVGGAAEGWMSGACSAGPSQRLNGSLFKTILSGKETHLGRALLQAKSTLSNINYNTLGRWLTFSVMIMGDPEMPVFTSRPHIFDSVIVSVRNDSLLVTPNVRGCKVCVMSDYDKGNDYYEVRNDITNYTLNSGFVKSFSFNPSVGSYSVCITRPGYVPYIIHVRNSEFIQNETFDTETTIYGNNIQIGRNVTTSKEEGPVVVDSNKTVVSSSGEVLIKNDFEVKKGAEFCIESNNQP